MKTVLIVVVLVVVAVSAGSSFLLQASAQQPSATLDVSCTPAAVPPGEDTLLSCRFVAMNTGSAELSDVRIDLVPAPDLPIPDRYIFFAARLDGVPFEVEWSQIGYSLGTIASGASRTLELDVIIRSSQPSGADAVLVVPGAELARARIGPAGEPQASPIRLAVEQRRDPLDVTNRQFTVGVSSDSERIVFIAADVILSYGYTIADHFRRPDFLAPVPPPGRIPLVSVEISPYITPGEQEFVTFDVRAVEPCYGGQVGVVFQVRNEAGDVFRPAFIADLPYDEACAGSGGAQGGGGETTDGDATVALPRAGAGASQTTVEGMLMLLALTGGMLGFALVGVGLYATSRRR